MDRLGTLLTALVTAMAGLAISLFLLALVSREGATPLDLIWRIVLEGPPADIPFFVPLAPLLFLTTILAAVVGVIYYFVMPEIRNYAVSQRSSSEVAAAQMVMRTLNNEEQRVIEVLQAHGGKYLQKYITKEAGLSKLKTHRIIARFAERGIVMVARKGNTNEVTLAGWFQSKNKS
ncbi:MAG: hypothetical protein HY619_08060 [Thaumarchaeota archaeon]|nr:hypothetical protein [Nitrososphaerota archaeon]